MESYAGHIKNQNGSALISVLSVVVVLTILVGTMLAVYVVQDRFIQKDFKKLQALYTAEAGVYATMGMLRENPLWEVADTLLTPIEGKSSSVAVEAQGGYYLIRSSAIETQFQVSVVAMVMQKPPAIFDMALYLWDTTSRLNVAGSTVIIGDIAVGRLGIRQNTFNGIRFTGELHGVAAYDPDIQPAYFDDAFLQRSVNRFDDLLHNGHSANREVAPDSVLDHTILLPSELPVYFIDGDLHLSTSDSLLLKKPVSVVVTGDLVLEGPLQFATGSRFLAGKKLLLEGPISGDRGVFYGMQSLNTRGHTVCKGQFFSRRQLAIRDTTYLKHPTLLFLAGVDAVNTGAIEISGRSRVDGNLIHGFLPETPTDVRGRVVIGPHALVRGAVYNPFETEIRGTLYGALLTHQLFFYQTPTRYINWMLDAVVDVNLRPAGFVVPLLFSPAPELEVVSWHVSRHLVPLK